MESVRGRPIHEMLNRSFYEVYPDEDRTLIVTYADVAMNGTNRVVTDYSPEARKHLRISCFQPEPGYCACLFAAAD